MDATFKYYLEFSPQQALSLTQELLEEVKKVSGTFTLLWHNETFSDLELEGVESVVRANSKTS